MKHQVIEANIGWFRNGGWEDLGAIICTFEYLHLCIDSRTDMVCNRINKILT